MNSQRTFWLVQIGIWGSFMLLNLFGRGYFVHFKMGELVNSLSLFISLMVASAFLRRYYRNVNTDSMGVYIGRALLGSVIAGLIAIGITALILLPNQEAIFGFVNEYAYLQILMSFPIMFILSLCWSSVYLLIKRQKALKLAQTRERELNEQLANSRMDLLLNQLNPHFMFNAINNIRALILEDSEKARESLAQLSDVLRVTLLSKQDKLWSLAQEIELTKSFITLNALQFEDRLSVNWRIDGDPNKWQVPSLSLQLLVENAIKHGIGKNPLGGTVDITIDANETLSMEVTNPGQITASSDSTGLGITNVQQRLNLLFGDAGSFSLQEEHNKVKASIKLETLPCTAP